MRAIRHSEILTAQALLLLMLGVPSLGNAAPPLDVPIVVKNQGFLPFADAPIYYRTSQNLTDPIAKLQKQLDKGDVKLDYEPEHGYLRSVLKLLHVPITSQTL